jgi:hypothetical protein
MDTVLRSVLSQAWDRIVRRGDGTSMPPRTDTR